MEVTKENISEVLKDENFINDILPSITESELVTSLIANKADAEYKSKIEEEVRTMYGKADDDMFGILGERPGSKDNGSKQKTYEKQKELYSELKGLREKEQSLTVDARVIELNSKIETLKKDGGGSHVQAVFDQAKDDWKEEKEGYLKTISDASTNNDSFKKRTEIASAMREIKFNPDVTESIKKMVLDNVEKELIQNSKFENDKLVYLKADGKPALNAEFKEKSTLEMLKSNEAIKDISLKSENKRGGGADTTIVGSIHTTSVEGNDTKKLVLPEGSFKSKTEFGIEADKALFASGLTKRDGDFDKLKNQAYKEYKVADMPIQ